MREQFSLSSNLLTATLEPNSINSFPQMANGFYFVAATAPVSVSMDSGPRKPYRRGTGETLPNGEFFKRLEITNENPFQVAIQLWLGWGEYIDSRFEIVDNKTKYVASDITEVPANDSVEFDGAPDGFLMQRKSIFISNMDANISLFLSDSEENTGLVVFPETSVVLDTSDSVKIANETGSPVQVRIAETWYIHAQ